MMHTEGMLYVATDLANPGQRLVFRSGGSHHRYLFKDSNLSPKVGERIRIGTHTRVITKVERANVPGQFVAIVHAR